MGQFREAAHMMMDQLVEEEGISMDEAVMKETTDMMQVFPKMILIS